MKTLLVVLIATSLAQVVPSCGESSREPLVGWVEAKRATGQEFTITINSVDYVVPGYFWSQVDVGDLVKWDGMTWTLVRKKET